MQTPGSQSAIRGNGRVVGILLAAGRGRRFDPDGVRNKLLQSLENGSSVAVAAAENLLAAIPDVLAVVRPDAAEVGQLLQRVGCEISVCPIADQGMAASLVHALDATRAARGWVIALADMPYVKPDTIRALLAALEQGAQIAAPVHRGRRGNPVAFDRSLLPDLLQMCGDEGARSLLRRFPVREVAVDDAGVIRDIDTAADLAP